MLDKELFNKLADFDDGLLPHNESISLFQGLIDTGVVWDLEERYQDEAMRLLNRGDCSI